MKKKGIERVEAAIKGGNSSKDWAYLNGGSSSILPDCSRFECLNLLGSTNPSIVIDPCRVRVLPTHTGGNMNIWGGSLRLLLNFLARERETESIVQWEGEK